MPLILPNSARVGRPLPNNSGRGLSFPVGAAPSFDLAHPAATAGCFSAVMTGNGPVDLSTGASPTTTGTPTTSVHSAIGVYTYSASGGNRYSWTKNYTTPASYTMAAMFVPQDVTTNVYHTIIAATAANVGFYLKGAWLDFYFGGEAIMTTTANQLSVGVPYFVAVSGNFASGIANFVFTNLNTGVIISQTISFSHASVTMASQSVGDDGASEPSKGYGSAWMVSTAFLSPSQLLQWAQDPWRFWYPSNQSPSWPNITSLGGWNFRRRLANASALRPLSFPSGAAPGFDPSHVASANIRLSAVASGLVPNFQNLLNGKPGTLVSSGSLLSGMHGIVGPIGWSTAAASYVTFAAASTAAESKNTYGAIITPKSSQSFAAIFQSDGSTNNCLYITNNNTLIMFAPGAHVSIATNFTNGTPYFVAVSVDLPNALANFLVVNLNTGQVATSFATAFIGSPSSSHTPTLYYLLSDVFDTPGIAEHAVMYSAAAMSPSQMLAWAKDPWSFWYPQKTDQVITTLATPGTTAAAGWRSWLALLGVG